MERVHYVGNTRKGYLLYLTLHPLSHCRYGFNYGCIHFVLMSTEHFFDPTSPQYAFLEAHLRSVDRSVTPWLVFAGHRPMYIDSTNASPVSGDLTVAKLLRKNLEPMLVVSGGCLCFRHNHYLCNDGLRDMVRALFVVVPPTIIAQN